MTPSPANPTTGGHHWLISENSAGLFPIRTGTADTAAAAWAAAITAGRDALIHGHIHDLAIAVDDTIPTFGYSPSRDHHGRLDPHHVTPDLNELLRDTLHDLPAWPPPHPTDLPIPASQEVHLHPKRGKVIPDSRCYPPPDKER